MQAAEVTALRVIAVSVRNHGRCRRSGCSASSDNSKEDEEEEDDNNDETEGEGGRRGGNSML